MASKKAANPEFIAEAMKRVMPLIKKLPKHLQFPEKALIAAAHRRPNVEHRNKSSSEEGAPIAFGNDVIIDGSFEVGCTVIVLGDLKVDGVLEAMWDDVSVIVGGSIYARGINCTDNILAAGSIHTDVLFVELAGKLAAGKGVQTDLAILEDKTVKIDGKLTAKQQVVLTYPSTNGLDQLKAILAPKAFGTVDGHDALYDYTNLFKTVRAGKPWRANGASKSVRPAASKSAAPAKKTIEPKKTAAKRARYFEFVDRTSKKFWEISIDGASFTTRYGRLGTDGQSTKKSFPTPEKAKAEADKLTREKTNKGYRER